MNNAPILKKSRDQEQRKKMDGIRPILVLDKTHVKILNLKTEEKRKKEKEKKIGYNNERK